MWLVIWGICLDLSPSGDHQTSHKKREGGPWAWFGYRVDSGELEWGTFFLVKFLEMTGNSMSKSSSNYLLKPLPLPLRSVFRQQTHFL